MPNDVIPGLGCREEFDSKPELQTNEPIPSLKATHTTASMQRVSRLLSSGMGSKDNSGEASEVVRATRTYDHTKIHLCRLEQLHSHIYIYTHLCIYIYIYTHTRAQAYVDRHIQTRAHPHIRCENAGSTKATQTTLK